MATSLPSPASIAHAQFTHLRSLYPAIVKRVYEGKIKDGKKLGQALEDDAWRYEGLVKVLEGRRKSKDGGAGGWIEKAELERLVRWKITHGTNRPFLPAQIRKNEPSFVKSATSSAFAAPSPPASTTSTFPSFPTEALKHLTTLTGVGPATATLLLSVHDPVDMPFFQDELYHWLCGSETKLKYNMKEYKELFEKVGELRQRLSNAVTADEMEKVGFVVGHLDLLEEEERKGLERQLEKSKDQHIDTVAGTGKKNESLKAKAPMANAAGKGKRRAPEDEEEKHTTEAKAKRKRKSAAAETSTPTRKSQRSR